MYICTYAEFGVIATFGPGGRLSSKLFSNKLTQKRIKTYYTHVYTVLTAYQDENQDD